MKFHPAILKTILLNFVLTVLMLSPAINTFGGAGSVDTTFNVNPNGTVYALLTEPNGEILVGGAFTTINGVNRYGLAKLYPDGTLDPTFTNILNFGGTVYAMLLQPDGKLLVGGNFSSQYNQTRQNVARLNVDGSVDATFTNSAPGSTVYALGLQTNGQVLIGGGFSSFYVNGIYTNHYYIARLNTDGTVDNAFNAGTISGQLVNAIAVQPDGNILIGGTFSSFSTYGLTRQNLARLTTNGTPDLSYAPTASTTVQSIFIEPGGKSLWGGVFTTLNNNTRTRVGRLNTDGTLDGGFTAPIGANSSVYAVTEDANNNIYVGGAFSSYNNSTREGVARLYADGTLDSTFNVTTNFITPQIRALAVQSDGKVLAGGSFTTFNSSPRTNLVRLYGNSYPAQIVNQPQGTNVTPGANVTFSVDVSNPTAVSYQWLYNGVNIPGATDSEYSLFNVQTSEAGIYSVFVSTALGGTSSSNAVLQVGTPLAITQQPTNQTVVQGATAAFTIAASGTPLYYYWVTGKTLAGTNATLTLTNVQPSQAGSYVCVVSNFLGTATSAPVTLTVLYPIAIVGAPASSSVAVGGTATFGVAATGNPRNYQWYGNGSLISGATALQYSITNVSLTNAGSYYVVVSNQFNSVTSSVATLAVGIPPQNLQIQIVSNQFPELLMTGTPGFSYDLQTTTNWQAPVMWQYVATLPTATNGVWSYVDTNGFSSSALYYRVAIP